MFALGIGCVCFGRWLLNNNRHSAQPHCMPFTPDAFPPLPPPAPVHICVVMRARVGVLCTADVYLSVPCLWAFVGVCAAHCQTAAVVLWSGIYCVQQPCLNLYSQSLVTALLFSCMYNPLYDGEKQLYDCESAVVVLCDLLSQSVACVRVRPAGGGCPRILLTASDPHFTLTCALYIVHAWPRVCTKPSTSVRLLLHKLGCCHAPRSCFSVSCSLV